MRDISGYEWSHPVKSHLLRLSILLALQNYYLYLLSFALTADELCGALVQYCTAPSAMLAHTIKVPGRPYWDRVGAARSGLQNGGSESCSTQHSAISSYVELGKERQVFCLRHLIFQNCAHIYWWDRPCAAHRAAVGTWNEFGRERDMHSSDRKF